MSRKARRLSRVTWTVIRQHGEWFSLVKLGEIPMTNGPFPSKRAARDEARKRASTFLTAGK